MLQRPLKFRVAASGATGLPPLISLNCLLLVLLLLLVSPSSRRPRAWPSAMPACDSATNSGSSVLPVGGGHRARALAASSGCIMVRRETEAARPAPAACFGERRGLAGSARRPSTNFRQYPSAGKTEGTAPARSWLSPWRHGRGPWKRQRPAGSRSLWSCSWSGQRRWRAEKLGSEVDATLDRHPTPPGAGKEAGTSSRRATTSGGSGARRAATSGRGWTAIG